MASSSRYSAVAGAGAGAGVSRGGSATADVIMGAAVSAIAAIGGGPRSTETRHFGKYDWTSAPSAEGSARQFPTR